MSSENVSLNTIGYVAAPDLIEVVTHDRVTRTLVLADKGKRIYCTNASGCAVTVPDAWPSGYAVVVHASLDAGAVTIVRASGMTFESAAGDATLTVTAGGEACVAGIDATSGATVVAVNGSVS